MEGRGTYYVNQATTSICRHSHREPRLVCARLGRAKLLVRSLPNSAGMSTAAIISSGAHSEPKSKIPMWTSLMPSTHNEPRFAGYFIFGARHLVYRKTCQCQRRVRALLTRGFRNRTQNRLRPNRQYCDITSLQDFAET